MNTCQTRSSLSESCQLLLDTMHRIGFGRIEKLAVRDGEPVFHPAPRVVQDIKLGEFAPNVPLPVGTDFLLKAQVIALFDHLRRLGDGELEVIHIQNGLPFRVVVERIL